MTYRNNVSRLAAKLNLSNDPGLREEDIRIAELVFTTHDGTEIPIPGTDMNRGGRLFFQYFCAGPERLVINEAFLVSAKTYFAELWEPDPVPGKRKLLDALRASKFVRVIWK